MTAEITALPGARVPNEPSKEIIETLERLLEQAKSGDLIGFAYASVRQNDTWGTGWDGEAGTRHRLSTGITALHWRYCKAMLDGD